MNDIEIFDPYSEIIEIAKKIGFKEEEEKNEDGY